MAGLGRIVNAPRTAGFAMLMVGLSSIGFGLVPYFARTLTEAGLAAPAAASVLMALPWRRVY